MSNGRKIVAALGMLISSAALSPAQDSPYAVRQQMLKPVVRGGIVFKTYCVLCHGERGDGRARASRLYRGLNLTITQRTPGYISRIVRLGGKSVGSSEFMPPWQNELSTEQISDVIIYLGAVRDPVRRGDVIYKNNCVLCHGVNADGKGRAAALYDPPPADLTRSQKDDRYRADIIRRGGSALNRSDSMPAWGEWLSDLDISDIVVYLRSLPQSAATSIPPKIKAKP